MRTLSSIGLAEVQAVYSGAECDLWQLLMGTQIHIGGLSSSIDLAERAGIQPGMHGVDLCCCRGAGMHFLVRFRQAASMKGVDATPRMIDEGRVWAAKQGLASQIEFVPAAATKTGLPSGSADFVWGEDAWCYVDNKSALIAEAARLVRPGGIIAFTDWLEGPKRLTDTEAHRFMAFMKFPSLASLDDYRTLLESNGCKIKCAENTSRFASACELYLDMLDRQLTFDALQILNFDQELAGAIRGELVWILELARAGKLIQGVFAATK